MTIVMVGIDLAKNVFAVHGVDATGKPVLLRPSVPRAKLAAQTPYELRSFFWGEQISEGSGSITKGPPTTVGFGMGVQLHYNPTPLIF